MVICPICGATSSDEPRDGRCPSCHGVIAWDRALEESETRLDSTADEPSLPPAGQSVEQFDQTGAEPEPVAPAAQSDGRLDSPVDAPASPTMHEEPRLESARTVKSRRGSDTERARVTAMWADAPADAVSARSTIKSESPALDGTSNLVIRSRVIRDAAEPAPGPAEYELLQVIGEGGMGVVYAARQASIDRTVALKMLKREGADFNEREKFLSEAMVTGELDHPNIVPIYDLGSDARGALFYSMKRVQGTPWSQVIHSKSTAENLEILLKVCDAIAFAHARGVVHRDIKPENVMLGEFGEVLVMDWGIALSTSLFVKSGSIATSSCMGGTPAYMAPEMATGPLEVIGVPSDVYLLGATLYEIVTGLTPHMGDDAMACLMAAARNEIQPTERTGELLDIALKAMSTEIKHRYATVLELQQAIRGYQEHSESIVLSSRAEEELDTARHSRDYQDFSRALFAFDEARALWTGNRRAESGQRLARLEYAQTALEKGDFDLGVSLLDEDLAEHRPLRQKLVAAMRERDARQARLKYLRSLAVGLVAVMLIGSTSASLIILNLWHSATRSADEAKAQRNEARKAKGLAEDAAELAGQRERDAVEAEGIAQQEKERAIDAKQRAEVSQRQALAAAQREEQASYFSAVRLAYEQIRSNDFQSARETLSQQEVATKQRLRHWEWGHLRYLCGLDEATLKADNAGSLEAVAWSDSADAIATGSANGFVFLWPGHPESPDQQAQPMAILQHGSPVFTVAFSHDGRSLATAGGDQRQGVVKVWDVNSIIQASTNNQNAEPIKVFDGQFAHEARVTSVRFSRDDRQLLTSSADHTARLLSPWQGTPSTPIFYRGHFDTVHSAAFSHDPRQNWVVTASADGSVGIWDRQTGAQLERLSGHRGAVFSAAFSPTNHQVASAGYDKRILLWDIDDVLQPQVARGTEGSERGQAFRERFVSEVEDRLRGEPVRPREYRQLLGHASSVHCVCFSAGGRLLLTGGRDNTLKIWDVEFSRRLDNDNDTESALLRRLRAMNDIGDSDDESLLTLRGHGSWVSSGAFSSDSRKVLSASYDGTAKIWNLQSYNQLQVFRGPERAVSAAAISPDGLRVAAAFDDGTASVWSIDKDGQVRIPPLKEGHDYLASKAEFSRDGQRLFTTAGDGTVRVWNVETGAEIRTLEGTGPRGVLALAPQGQWLVTGSTQNDALLWDTATFSTRKLGQAETLRQQLRQQFPTADPQELERNIPDITTACFSPDGRTVYTGDTDGVGWLWDVQSGSLIQRLSGHRLAVTTAAFAPDGSVLLTGSIDRDVREWDGKSGRETGRRWTHPGVVTALDVRLTANGQIMILTASLISDARRPDGAENRDSGVEIRLWTADDFAAKPPMRLQVDRVNSLRFFPREQSALIAASHGLRHQVLRWDFEQTTASHLWNDSVKRGAVSAAVFPPEIVGDKILIVGGNGATLWDRATGREVISYRPHDAITAIDFAPDNRHVVTSGLDGSAKIWNIDEDQARVDWKLEGGLAQDPLLRGHQGAVNSAQFHPQPQVRQVLTAGDDHTAKLWSFNEATGQYEVLRTFGGSNGHTDKVNRAVFSTGGDRILTVSQDGTARLWNAQDAEQPPSLLDTADRRRSPILTGTFSPDDRWVMTSDADRTVTIYETETGRTLVRLKRFSLSPRSIAFSPDQQRIVASDERFIRLFDLQPLAELLAADQVAQELPLTSLREVLTLEHHEREITSIAFSSSGNDVLSASEDGTAVLWKGSYIEPAVVLSLDLVQYTHPSRRIPLDPRALVKIPSLDTLGQLSLVVRVSNGPATTGQHEWLEIQDDPSAQFQVTADGKLRLGGGSEPLEFATLVAPPQADQPLIVRLHSNATPAALETLLRNITYRHDGPLETEATRDIQVYFTPDPSLPLGDVSVPFKTIQLLPAVRVES